MNGIMSRWPVLQNHRVTPEDLDDDGAIRDEVERYEFWRNGKQATLSLSAPVGSDNVDPWKVVTDSFTWR